MTSCKVILNSLNTLLGLNFTGTYFLDFGKKVFRGVGFIFAISKTKYEKTALNFMIQAFSTSFYFSKSLNIFTILNDSYSIPILQHKNNIANFTTRYKMELTRTS